MTGLTLVEVLFAVAVLGLLYPYLLYPLLLRGVARYFARPLTAQDGELPTIAILVSAFNAERRIRDKIANFDSLDYPADRIQLWIGTDCSDDRTADVIRAIANPRVRLIERRQRGGKTAVLNDLARRANAEIFVITNVNALFRPDAIRQLVAVLADPTVGLASGRTETERAEWSLSSRESSCGWSSGADGAIYAMRAELYRELPAELISDLAHPCDVAAAGWQARFASLAISDEPQSDDAGRELHRQARITAQEAYLLAVETRVLVLAGCWGMLWVLLSRKWMRWTFAVWMVLGSITLALLSPALGLLEGALLVALVAGWIAGGRWAEPPIHFILIHLAHMQGLWHALKGRRYATWEPGAG